LLLSLPKETRDIVLLPAFHCVALVEPVLRAGYRAVFYRVRPDFTIDLEDLNSKCSLRDALIVVIHFFGFPADVGPVISMARANGSYVVEDCAHSFLSGYQNDYLGHRGDFSLYSYCKFAPSLAGGGLGVNRTDFTLRNLGVQVRLRERLVIAKRLLEQAASNSAHTPVGRLLLWLEQKRIKAKRVIGSKTLSRGAVASEFLDDPYLWREDLARAAMPSLCRRILEFCDWKGIALARQSNYRLLSRVIGDTPLARRAIPDLPDSVVPFAFPVLLENRVDHEQELRLRGVPLFTFGETLHPALSAIHDRARADAENLSHRLLVLPVHASLGEDEITGYASVFRRYVEEVETSQESEIPRLKLLEQPATTSKGSRP
jgi:hypothetical protein